MTQQGVRWTADQVLALAPDAASRKAGSRLGAAGPWSETGSSGDGTVWGLCKGSGSKPYQTVVDIADTAGPAYKCSCPSRKFPCKHALGLLLLWAGGDGGVPDAQAPEWAEQWIGGRRQRAEQKRTAGPSPATSGDPEAARRRAEKRAERVTAGAMELEQRLADLLRSGLASAESSGYGLWEETAARMVDAQAPGLAARVRELGAIPSSGSGWPARLLEECALIHLLDQGWLRREQLPDSLAATVRSRIGLPAAAAGPAVRDRWLVLAQYDTADSHLTTRRIWLYGEESGRMVLLLSYGAAGRAPALALPVGLALDAEVSSYPGAGQLRADLGEQFTPPTPTAVRPAGVSTTQAVARYGEALKDDPWLESWPVTLDRVIPAPDGDGWQLADADGKSALLLASSAMSGSGLWRLVAVSGGAPVTVFGECGHRGFTPLAVWPEGPGEPIPLC
ncbi:SWIM zinc finger family protein [Streptomyces himalayensis]|uniref:SWIM zinc finger family protein n=1 Tax=Streptomyces himalayensis subsp. himalayensis TaxID=2756131 RepID=A0A7W0DN97_9ACTN|nr:SWIM zinc finger family protein [Streptomyces himalayensis]MBA2948218.1 SWIM zinc finger family protein [Streptomyces himalayensis subsp. himalayensis]